MTLKEFLDQYVSPGEPISVFVVDKEGFYVDTAIYFKLARDVVEGKVGKEYYNYKVAFVRSGNSLIIDVKGE